MILTETDIQVHISGKVLHSLNLQVQRTTIVHCVYKADVVMGDIIRIWNCTVLKEDTGRECKLLHAEGIAIAPAWMLVPESVYQFTLIFEGLSRSCTEFTLDESISEPGGFFVPGIVRNRTDVYTVEIREGIKK